MNPKDIYSKINEILNQDFLYNDNQRLIENEVLAKCQEVKIKFTGSVSIYKFDTSNVFPFFSNGNQKSLCDYFIFYPKDKKLYIFLCNLKSDNDANTHFQTHSGHIFGKFILENACKILYNQNFSDTIIQFRAIHFNTKTPKKGVNPRNLKFFKYSNGLEYLPLSCKEIANFEILTKIK